MYKSYKQYVIVFNTRVRNYEVRKSCHKTTEYEDRSLTHHIRVMDLYTRII